jgi:hypothetical protein
VSSIAICTLFPEGSKDDCCRPGTLDEHDGTVVAAVAHGAMAAD